MVWVSVHQKSKHAQRSGAATPGGLPLSLAGPAGSVAQVRCRGCVGREQRTSVIFSRKSTAKRYRVACGKPLLRFNADTQVTSGHHSLRVQPTSPRGTTAMSSSPIVVQRDTKAWQLQVWVSFGISVFLCAVGLAWLPGEQLEQAFMVMGYVFCLSAWGLMSMDISVPYKAFLGVSWLYLITPAFTLAKMLRDRHEADLMDARLQGRREAAQAAANGSSAN